MRVTLALVCWMAACGGQEPPPASPTEQPSIGGSSGMFALTLADDGGGSLLARSALCVGSKCVMTLPRGTQVEVAAVPDKGWKFTGFSGDCSGLTCVVTMDADRTVVGAFARVNP